MWLNKIKLNSIGSFKKLSENFVNYFIAGQKYSKLSTCLFSVKQEKNESLRDYTNRFTKESMQVEAQKIKSIAAYIDGLYSGQLLFALTKEPPSTMVELMLKAQQHMNSKDALNARCSRDDNYDSQYYQTGKLRTNPNKRPRDKWCKFHSDHHHETDDYIDLKHQIEDLIQRGQFKRFIKVVEYWIRKAPASQVNLDGIFWKTNTAKGKDCPPSYLGRRGQPSNPHDRFSGYR
ncbi:hypothetical protein Vadar_029774 [Vaccinium darrowii]|uniref:Uncharacterized protein n=1 Tax=Vaccinium darrowii TaxID=229202 RepID=A0ACB7YA21_9ERIC|nr:hypothetical protein Vadar_029774 [Vaccinium darrowii]